VSVRLMAAARLGGMQAGRVVVEEQAGDEAASRAGPGLVENRLQVILDREGREMKSLPNVVGGKTFCDEFGDASFAIGEPVRVGDQRRELGRLDLFHQDGDRGVRTIAQHRTPHGYPIPLCGTNTRPGERVRPTFAPFGITLIIAGDAQRPCRHGKHGDRQLRTRYVTGAEIGKPAHSSRGGRVDGVVRAEYDDPGPTLVGHDRVTDDRGAAKALGHQRSQRRQKADLRVFEAGSPGSRSRHTAPQVP
jgi:hypothetical protein